MRSWHAQFVGFISTFAMTSTKIAREIYRVLVDLHYSSPVEAIYFTVESKSLPSEVNSSTFESHCSLSVEAKDKLATIESKCRLVVEANRSRLLI